MKDNIINEKEGYKDIGLRGFDYTLFEENEGEGTRDGVDGYPYFKNLIQLCPGDWVKQVSKINEAVDVKNRFKMDGEGKRLVCLFKRQDIWKCIG